jgi:hypothetical protein
VALADGEDPEGDEEDQVKQATYHEGDAVSGEDGHGRSIPEAAA